MEKYVVVDLEMCQVPKAARTEEYNYYNETIQIGAVLLDENYDVVSRFSTYVAPQFGSLTSKIKRLTGITEENLEGAPVLGEALQNFADWLPENELTFVEWSVSDETQLKREINSKAIDNKKASKLLEKCEDCQALFSKRANYSRKFNLTEALNAAGIYPEGHEHDGLSDAYNTAILYKKLKTEEDLHLNPIFESARSETVEHLGYSLGSLLAGFDLSALPAC